jgi:hypothetical protein
VHAGAACGVPTPPAPPPVPVAPPPDIDVEEWHATIAEIGRRGPERLALIHFGVEPEVADHLGRLGEELDRWAARVRDGMTIEQFAMAARLDAGEDADLYDRVAPTWQSWHGLRRYWDKRELAAQ